MTTSHADHALALRLIQEVCTLDQANAVMARFNAAGIYLVKVDPPAEPQTGPKAKDSSPHVDRLRRELELAKAKRTNATKETA